MSALPSTRPSKTIHRPSGDHRGEPDAPRSNEESRLWCWPSVSEIQTPALPDRVEATTILLPSGEHWDDTSALVDAISVLADCLFAMLPDKSACQMLLSLTVCAQARRLPCCEMAKLVTNWPTASIRCG